MDRDERLVHLLAEAHAVHTQVLAMGDVSLVRAAAALGCCRTRLGQHLRLGFLTPNIVEAILAGRQPKALTRKRLAGIDLPIDWREQRMMLGFA